MNLSKEESQVLELLMQIAKVLDTDSVTDDTVTIKLALTKESVLQ